MVGEGGTARPVTPQTRFSDDGFWWWDGAEWRAAVSPDGMWRWNGQTWVPARPPGPPAASGGGVGLTIGLTAGVFAIVLILVSAIVVVILLTMGGQIANVFSNVTAALG
jgi:hypothetical protein